MATNTAKFDVPPERVWAVLADADSFGDWVVGTKHIRDADPQWPEVGARIHHNVGIGPVKVNDDTEVLEARAPERLVLRARARPSGTANVVIELRPEGGGTTVVMDEYPVSGIAKVVHNPLHDKLIHHRNVESLRRLERLAARRGAGS